MASRQLSVVGIVVAGILLGIAFHGLNQRFSVTLSDAEQESIVVSKLKSALDVSEFHARIAEQEVQIMRLMRSGMGTDIADRQLLELKETLAFRARIHRSRPSRHWNVTLRSCRLRRDQIVIEE